MLAIDGKADFLKKTNPFGPPQKETPTEKVAKQREQFRLMKMDARNVK
jgi:hypothetical protein